MNRNDLKLLNSTDIADSTVIRPNDCFVTCVNVSDNCTERETHSHRTQ